MPDLMNLERHQYLRGACNLVWYCLKVQYQICLIRSSNTEIVMAKDIIIKPIISEKAEEDFRKTSINMLSGGRQRA